MVVVVAGDGSAQGNGCVRLPGGGFFGQNGNGDAVASGGDGIPPSAGSMSATTPAANHSDTTTATASEIGGGDGIFAAVLEEFVPKVV
uniref:Uncharacterized protein n=1 Tax=Leersia perrieri TaxID=77586 RepID=A0A0D9UVZ1_9ORYZ